MGFIKGFKKNLRVMKISQVLGQPFNPSAGISDLLSGKESPRKQAENEMYDLIEGDSDCGKILDKYHAGREKLSELYWLMVSAGAGTWIYKHYVPVTALCFPLTLDYMLANKGRENDLQLVHGVMDIISRGKFDRMPVEFVKPQMGPK